MIVDLNPMYYRHATELVRWCYEHDVDKENCARIITAWTISPTPDIPWEIDIPEKYITYFLLKWSSKL